jgi:hypothetical protein
MKVRRDLTTESTEGTEEDKIRVKTEGKEFSLPLGLLSSSVPSVLSVVNPAFVFSVLRVPSS